MIVEIPAYDKPGSLVVATRNLLLEDNRTALDLHKATDLPLYWITSFRLNKSNSPNVNRVQTLYEFLSGKKLTF